MYSSLKFSLFKSDSENLLRKPGGWTANRQHILACGILNSVQEIRNPTEHWNPESSSTDKECRIWYLESRIHGEDSRIQQSWISLCGANPRGEHSMIEWIRKKTTLFTWAAFAGALESGKLADCCKVHSGYWSRTWTFSLNICANSLKLKAACRFPRDLARLEACLISFMSS